MFFSFLKDYQSGLVGILGFAGVITTLWWNARIAEQARLRLTEQERTAVRSGLVAELDTACLYFRDLCRLLASGQKEYRIAIVPPMDLYLALREKIVLLTTIEVSSVVRVYTMIRHRSEVFAGGTSPEMSIFTLNEESIPRVMHDFERLIREVEKTQTVIQHHLD
jgi:hypothetical protein